MKSHTFAAFVGALMTLFGLSLIEVMETREDGTHDLVIVDDCSMNIYKMRG